MGICDKMNTSIKSDIFINALRFFKNQSNSKMEKIRIIGKRIKLSHALTSVNGFRTTSMMINDNMISEKKPLAYINRIARINHFHSNL